MPVRRSAAPLRRALFVLSAGLALATCTDPVGPEGLPLLRPGATLTLTASAGDTLLLELEREATRLPWVVALSGTGDSLEVLVRTNGRLAEFRRVALSPSAEVTFGPHAHSPDDGVLVRLRLVPIAGTASVQLRLDAQDPAPETAAPTIVPGQVVSSERIEHVADRDEFRVEAPVGTELVAFVQRTAPGQAVLDATLLDGRPETLDLMIAAPGPEEDEEAGSLGRFRVSAAAAPVIAVQSGYFIAPGRYVGPYRVRLRAVDRGVEGGAALLAAGDTVASQLDHVGDVDEFRLEGTPGDTYNLFVDATGEAPHAVAVAVVDTVAADTLRTIRLAAGARPLLDAPIGAFTIPASGRLRVGVAGTAAHGGLYRGAYRLFAVRLDPAPENRAAEIAPAPIPLRSAIEVRGDVDEYHFTLADTTEMAFALARLGGASAGSAVQGTLTAPDSTTRLTLSAGVNYLGVPGTAYSPRVLLAPGRWTLRVQGTGSDATTYMGGYDLTAAAVARAPELAPADLAVGDSVGEAMDYPGDVDAWTFSITAADTITVIVRTPAVADAERLSLVARDTTGTWVTGAFTRSFGTRGGNETGRLLLPGPGRWTVEVAQPFVEWDMPSNTPLGPFGIAIERVSARAETATALLALGDTVRTESIDVPGDIDEFTFAGAAGSEATVSLIKHGFGEWPISYFRMSIRVLDPADRRELLVHTGDVGTWMTTAPFTIPAAGRVIIQVAEPVYPPQEYSHDPFGLNVLGDYTLTAKPYVASAGN